MNGTAPLTLQHSSLHLNRRLQNHAFESWKIGANFVAGRTCVQVPGPVFLGAGEAVDFLHTRASVLRNHLLSSQGRLFVVTAGPGRSVCINEVTEAAGSPVLCHFAAVDCSPGVASSSTGPALEALLHCSLAVVAEPPRRQQQQQQDAAAPQLLLFSCGRGDLVLVTGAGAAAGQEAGGGAQVSPAVFPLRPGPPAVGVRPFTIEAAWRSSSSSSSSSSLLRCVLSCPHHAADAAGGGGSHGRPKQLGWVCETWLVTLEVTPTAGAAAAADLSSLQQQQQQQQLCVVDCQLLLVSRSPPAAAVAAAAQDRLLLVGEPGLEPDELPEGYRQQLAAVQGGRHHHHQRQAHEGAAGLSTPAAAVAAAAAGGDGGGDADMADGGRHDDHDDDDDDDVDPRTLAEAVARLAKYTSDAPVGDLPPQQWSDVFREAGPGEFGGAAGGGQEGEEAPDVMLFVRADAPASSSSNTSGGNTSSGNTRPAGTAAGAASRADRFVLHAAASCSPHRLLAAQGLSHTGSTSSSSSSSSTSSSSQPGVLLGLADDVDCALVSAVLLESSLQPPHAQQHQDAAAAVASGDSQHDAAAAPTAAPAAAAAAGAGGGGSGGVCLSHLAFLPALAYVVAGKSQRRHLLLAPCDGPSKTCSPVCAVLVEGTRYAYVYGQVASPTAAHGQQQIVDMELPPGEGVLGAALVPVADAAGRTAAAPLAAGAAAAASMVAANGAGAGAAPAAAGTVLLFLLTRSQLISYRLQPPSRAA